MFNGGRGRLRYAMNKISQTVSCQFDTVFSPFAAKDFDRALAFLSEAGFTGVELAIADPRDVDADALLEQVKSYGLAVTTLSTGQAYGLWGYCLSSVDAVKRNSAIEIIKGHIELSARLERPPVTIGLLRGKLETDEIPALRGRFKEAFLPLVEYAAKHDVLLQLEPICKAETVLINSTRDGLEFLSELGDPENVGLLYDTFHSYLEDGDMAAAVQAASGRIFNVHFSDSHRGLPGYGDIDYAPVIGALRASGYTGAYALETLAIPSPEFVNGHCYESIEALLSHE